MIENPQLNKEPIKVNRALISVFDKTGVVELAQQLEKFGVEILSTGGTAKTLKDSGIRVKDVSDYTNFPEIMDGRVKTINPLIEGGILGLRDKHEEEATQNNIDWIDLVICNLYPFSETISESDCDLETALENIDIGGPTMIRSAAKNLGWVTVVVDTGDYLSVISELVENQEISFQTRKVLSAKHLDTLHNMIPSYMDTLRMRSYLKTSR